MALIRALDSASHAERRRLPAIVFHLSVTGCNRLVQRLVASLEAEQEVEQVYAFCMMSLNKAHGILNSKITADDGFDTQRPEIKEACARFLELCDTMDAQKNALKLVQSPATGSWQSLRT